MRVSGFGTITRKGLEIIQYCKLNDVSLTFGQFYATDENIALTTLADSGNVTYGDITDYELEGVLDGLGTDYATGSISSADSPSTDENSSYLPLLCSLSSNNYVEDIQIYTMFLTAKDPESTKLTVDNTTNFNVSDSVSITGGSSGVVKAVDTTNSILYIEDVVPAPASGVVPSVGDTITSSSGGSAVISVVADAYYTFYQGAPAINEVQEMYITDATTFTSPAGNISSADGAYATISAISGNKLTIDRQNVTRFSSGDSVDNTSSYVAEVAKVVGDPSVDLTNSTIVPVTYVTDGGILLFRITLRYSSGFPSDTVFPNSAISEIEVHNNDASAHVDLRQWSILDTESLRREIRDLLVEVQSIKNRLDAGGL